MSDLTELISALAEAEAHEMELSRQARELGEKRDEAELRRVKADKALRDATRELVERERDVT